MILHKDKSFVTCSAFPDTDFAGDADWVIPDDSELAQDILRLSPNFDLIVSPEGELIDIVETEPEPAQEVKPAPTNAELAQQITDIQLALCDLYESGGA